MTDMLPRWEHFEHDADVGVRGWGHTRAQAFEQAAVAMTAAITDPTLVRPLTRVEIDCQDDDEELLLTDWLNALVYEMATRRMLFGRFSVRLDGRSLKAVAEGELDRRAQAPSGGGGERRYADRARGCAAGGRVLARAVRGGRLDRVRCPRGLAFAVRQ